LILHVGTLKEPIKVLYYILCRPKLSYRGFKDRQRYWWITKPKNRHSCILTIIKRTKAIVRDFQWELSQIIYWSRFVPSSLP